MKTLRVEDETHEKLTSLVGELTAQSGKMQTYADAITKMLETSIILPENLMKEISKAFEEGKLIGYTTTTDFVRDAVRRRLEEIKGEVFYVNIPIPKEEYELLNKAIEETEASYKNADDYIREHVHRKLEEYEKFRAERE
ncbi:MAG: ribbon-helix-helix domain-containing protein [Candidatus Bathyarchaeia archaeon]